MHIHLNILCVKIVEDSKDDAEHEENSYEEYRDVSNFDIPTLELLRLFNLWLWLDL